MPETEKKPKIDDAAAQQELNKIAAENREKDAALLRKLQDESLSQQRQMKAELDQIGREKRQAKGKDYWKKVEENADRLLSKGNEGYQDWVAGMNSIVNTMMDLAMALSLDPIGDSDYAAIGLLKFGAEFVNDIVLSPIHELLPYTKEREALKEGIVSGISHAVGGTGLGKLGIGTKTPDVKFSVNVDDEGHLISSATKDGKAFDTTDQMQFDAGLLIWARKNNYTQQPDPNNPQKVILKSTVDGSVMTPDTFRDLSMNAQTGLQSFMSGRFDMNMDYEPPRPNGP